MLMIIVPSRNWIRCQSPMKDNRKYFHSNIKQLGIWYVLTCYARHIDDTDRRPSIQTCSKWDQNSKAKGEISLADFKGAASFKKQQQFGAWDSILAMAHLVCCLIIMLNGSRAWQNRAIILILPSDCKGGYINVRGLESFRNRRGL